MNLIEYIDNTIRNMLSETEGKIPSLSVIKRFADILHNKNYKKAFELAKRKAATYPIAYIRGAHYYTENNTIHVDYIFICMEDILYLINIEIEYDLDSKTTKIVDVDKYRVGGIESISRINSLINKYRSELKQANFGPTIPYKLIYKDAYKHKPIKDIIDYIETEYKGE